MGIRNGRVKHIAELLGTMFEEEGLAAPIGAVDVCAEWAKVVGDFIASRSCVTCKGGVLYVNCDSSVVAKQLAMNRNGLRSALNGKVGREIITKIVIR